MYRLKRFFSGPHVAVVLFICCTVLAGSIAALAGTAENIALLARTGKAIAAVVKKAEPAVVHIRVVEKSIQGWGAGGQNQLNPLNNPFFERFFGPQFRHYRQPRRFKEEAFGSGFIIASNGYILTNNHVIAKAESITVGMSDGRQFKAKVVGADPESDVALIKINATDLPVLPMGNSDKLQVGEWVIAIGSPFELNQTVTVGVVSAKGRDRMGINDYENFIQTDAAINPGNSGGPLLNIYGEAIGMNTAIFSRSGGYMGIGFAIPINMARSIERQLRQHGKVIRGWLGVVIQNVTEDLAKSFGLNKAAGALVSEVMRKSPAARAGFKQGDVIIALDGKPLANVNALRNKIALAAPGSKHTLQLIRNGHKDNITVTIGEQPSNFGKGEITRNSPLKNMGLSLQNLTGDLAEHFGYKRGQGVLITEVAPASPAAQAGLQAGQLIEEVNKQRVHNLTELQKAVQSSPNPKQVLLRIRAGEYSQYVVLRAP